jgi:Domain of unknown function (DUF4252)
MKFRLFIYAALVAIPLMLTARGAYAQDDAIGKFFGKYVEDSRFTLVTVSPRMFRLLAKVDWDSISPDVRETVQKLHSLRILSTETTPGQFYKEALSKIDLKEYEELITVREKNSNTRFLIKENGATISELVMISVDEGDFTLLSFVGDIDLDKLSKLSSTMSIKGMENLKNAKKKK